MTDRTTREWTCTRDQLMAALRKARPVITEVSGDHIVGAYADKILSQLPMSSGARDAAEAVRSGD